MHDCTEEDAEDQDMPEAPNGRHDVVSSMFFCICDVKYYSYHRDSLRLS